MENKDFLEQIGNTEALDSAKKEIKELEGLSEELLIKNEELEEEKNNLDQKNSENIEKISNLDKKILENDKKISGYKKNISELKNNLEKIFNEEIKNLSESILDKKILNKDLNQEEKSEILTSSLDKFLSLKKESYGNKKYILELKSKNEKLGETIEQLISYNEVVLKKDKEKINRLENEILKNKEKISELDKKNNLFSEKFLEIGKKLFPDEKFSEEDFNSQEKISEFFVKILEKIEDLIKNFTEGGQKELDEKNKKNKELSYLITSLKKQNRYLVEGNNSLKLESCFLEEENLNLKISNQNFELQNSKNGEENEILNSQIADLSIGLKLSESENQILKLAFDEVLDEKISLEGIIGKLEEKLIGGEKVKETLIGVVNNLSEERNKISGELEKIKVENSAQKETIENQQEEISLKVKEISDKNSEIISLESEKGDLENEKNLAEYQADKVYGLLFTAVNKNENLENKIFKIYKNLESEKLKDLTIEKRIEFLDNFSKKLGKKLSIQRKLNNSNEESFNKILKEIKEKNNSKVLELKDELGNEKKKSQEKEGENSELKDKMNGFNQETLETSSILNNGIIDIDSYKVRLDKIKNNSNTNPALELAKKILKK